MRYEEVGQDWSTNEPILEPTGDPTPCENGEHLDVEGGICLLCGEWVMYQ